MKMLRILSIIEDTMVDGPGFRTSIYCAGCHHACPGCHNQQSVRAMTGSTNARKAAPGTIRGDFGMSFQENIIHTSDSPENAVVELNRFFKPEEIFDYNQAPFQFLYANDEY